MCLLRKASESKSLHCLRYFIKVFPMHQVSKSISFCKTEIRTKISLKNHVFTHLLGKAAISLTNFKKHKSGAIFLENSII